MTRLRQVIADNMVAALRTSAQLTTVVEADVTGLVRLRAREMDAFAAREGIRLSPMPFFVKAAAEAAILGIGATVKRPVALEPPGLGPVIVVRDLVYLALSYDHRIVDGADAARFLATVKRRLEDVDSPGHLGL